MSGSWGSGFKSEYGMYGPEELLYRPFETQIGAMNVKQLAEAWGVNRDTASKMRSCPWECVDTPVEVDDERKRQVREWLRVQVENLDKTQKPTLYYAEPVRKRVARKQPTQSR
jgi:hypothetical protein